MLRVIVCASVVVASALVMACGETASIDDPKGNSSLELQKKKDGSPTGDGATCSWAETTTYDVCASPSAPVPTYKLGDEFKSIDGCNECECTEKGIMCTVRDCGSGTGSVPPVPPKPPHGTVCTADAMKCPDGSWVGRTGPYCEFAPCAGQPPIVCDASIRICKDGTYGKQLPDSCKQICPEDGDPWPGCDKSLRVCKDGSHGQPVFGSCDQWCPEDGPKPPVGCPAIMRVCKDGSNGKSVPNTCEQWCPEDGETPPIACTDDARQCPDGSWVGRSGPTCEFVCPKK